MSEETETCIRASRDRYAAVKTRWYCQMLKKDSKSPAKTTEWAERLAHHKKMHPTTHDTNPE